MHSRLRMGPITAGATIEELATGACTQPSSEDSRGLGVPRSARRIGVYIASSVLRQPRPSDSRVRNPGPLHLRVFAHQLQPCRRYDLPDIEQVLNAPRSLLRLTSPALDSIGGIASRSTTGDAGRSWSSRTDARPH